MPAVVITPEDLTPFADIPEDKAYAMIADALAMARLVAPCIDSAEFGHDAAAKAVIRGAVLRWHDSGTGASAQLTALGFSQTYDTRQTRRVLFWPSEIQQLQQMCNEDSERSAWAYDMLGAPVRNHITACSFNVSADRCSCGVVLV
ncbi:hypothetical protein [Mycolicibacterium arenosum]|uniref:Uncharacterized protein n=1 Tax=Mycolicibacterium arenosum TaxID=2952157 RepID=A0ABT1M0U6_9MYCO|nr:hypothetical protein [Mycolicibacterium sp. CAU 1645]MCP9272773.1 hypothetical protein [Mycolicibacterium sp. CAU 1645]